MSLLQHEAHIKHWLIESDFTFFWSLSIVFLQGFSSGVFNVAGGRMRTTWNDWFRGSGHLDWKLILILQSYSESKMLVNLRKSQLHSFSFMAITVCPSSSSSPISRYVIWTLTQTMHCKQKRLGKSQNKPPVGNIPQVNRFICKRWSWLSMRPASWKGLFTRTLCQHMTLQGRERSLAVCRCLISRHNCKL